MSKLYVNVTTTEVDTEGVIKPKFMSFEDEEYPIDRIISIRPLNTLKSCGRGDGYWFKCVIGGRTIFLTYDGKTRKWQMELPAA